MNISFMKSSSDQQKFLLDLNNCLVTGSKTRRRVEHCNHHADGAWLHFTGLYRFYNDKVLPVTWQSMEEVISSSLSICSMSVRQVLSCNAKTYLYSLLTSS